MEQLNTQNQPSTKLNHFYHIYTGEEWLLTVHQHFVTLNAYGLMDSLENVYVGIIGKEEDRQAVISHLESYENPKIIVAIQAETGYEGSTLNKLWEFAKNDDGYIFYAHTKGSSRGGIVNQLWCRSMLFFNAVRWQFAVNEVRKPNIDAVGCHYLSKEKFPEFFEIQKEKNPNKHPFFAGNFWWAKSSHIKDLQQPQTEHEHSAEGWLGSNGVIRNIELLEGLPSLHLFQNITF